MLRRGEEGGGEEGGRASKSPLLPSLASLSVRSSREKEGSRRGDCSSLDTVDNSRGVCKRACHNSDKKAQTSSKEVSTVDGVRRCAWSVRAHLYARAQLLRPLIVGPRSPRGGNAIR